MKTGFALIRFLKFCYRASTQRLRMTPKTDMLHRFSLYFTLLSVPYRTQVCTTFTLCSLRTFRLASPCTEGSGFLCPSTSPPPTAGAHIVGPGKASPDQLQAQQSSTQHLSPCLPGEILHYDRELFSKANLKTSTSSVKKKKKGKEKT